MYIYTRLSCYLYVCIYACIYTFFINTDCEKKSKLDNKLFPLYIRLYYLCDHLGLPFSLNYYILKVDIFACAIVSSL